MDPKLASALEGLRDIHLPAPVSFWPPAPGWWLLAAFVVLATGLLIWFRRSRRRSVRLHALREVATLATRYEAEQKPVELAIALSLLIRRVALRVSPRDPVASLHGDSWIEFLTRGAKRESDAPGVVRDLFQTAYGGERAAVGDPRAWLDFTRSWIREVA